jgi:hypothetical protein
MIRYRDEKLNIGYGRYKVQYRCLPMITNRKSHWHSDVNGSRRHDPSPPPAVDTWPAPFLLGGRNSLVLNIALPPLAPVATSAADAFCVTTWGFACARYCVCCWGSWWSCCCAGWLQLLKEGRGRCCGLLHSPHTLRGYCTCTIV